jgi:predicted MFS family arabinose efflux permease
MAARIVAGAFGGPATSIALAMIADAIPPERRGKALGSVAGAFAAATVLGVPAGLWLADIGSWRTPFFGVAGLGLVVAAAAVALLPRFRGHLGATRAQQPIGALFRPTVLLSWAMTATVMMGTFALVPNLSTYFLGNLGYPRSDLSRLYLAGGTLSFFAMRIVGWLVDRHGSFRIGTAGTLWLLTVLYAGFVSPVPGLPVMALFLAFMLTNALRSVPLNTLTSKVPAPAERARFMSIQSAVQHLASSAGAFLSATLLREIPGGGIDGLQHVAILSMALAALFPVLCWAVETRVAPRSQPAPEVSPAA